MGLETLKTIGLESKRYAVRERMSPFVGEEPNNKGDFRMNQESEICLVGDIGFEPMTSAMSTQRSNRLS